MAFGKPLFCLFLSYLLSGVFERMKGNQLSTGRFTGESGSDFPHVVPKVVIEVLALGRFHKISEIPA